MIEINLIPSVKKELLKARMTRNIIISFSVLIGGGAIAVVVVLGLILGGQLAFEAISDGNIDRKGKELTAIEDVDKVITVQNQLNKITSQHESKKINSRIFDVISAVNPSGANSVSFSTITVDAKSKTIKLEGSAMRGYGALETLKKTILNTKIKTSKEGSDTEVALTEEIKDDEASFGDNAEGKKVLQFSFTITYPDELLAHLSGDARVAIITPTTKIDVTDARLGVPEDLFKKNADETNKDSSDKEER